MLFKVLLILLDVYMISSSLVMESAAQRSIFVTDYCPKMKHCPEGGHVMCMYYNAKSKMGPRCSNPQNITVTPELANKLIDVSNAIRSRISQGKEKGKDGEFLPRGYGIFRLNWDTELATFAQVLADQCVLRHDLCRATNRFPDPGQTAGLVRFSYPDWFPVSKSGNFTTPGMSQAKLMYATTQILKSWYGQKNAVTPNMITLYPDWTLNPDSQNGRLYLEMIYGSATHMGCGISAYTEYAYYDNNAPLNYNSVQIICNYSARPRKGTAVYNTVPPGDTAELFSKCGCPVGSEADDDCLCHHIQIHPIPHPTQLKQEVRTCPNGQMCDPAVVVLPIFTVEDAPPDKLMNRESFRNESLRKPMDDSIFQQRRNDLFYSKRNFYGPDKIIDKPLAYEYNGGTSQRQSRLNQNIRPTSHHKEIAIKNRYYDKRHDGKPQKSHARTQIVKSSLFSRAAKFELPGSRSLRPIKQDKVKDVVPRKDFSDAKQLVENYVHRKNDLHEPESNRQAIEERKATRADLHRNNIMNKPLFNSITHEEKARLNEHKLPKSEYETLKDIIESDHHLHEVLNILNATKPFKVSQEFSTYQKIEKLTTESIINTAEQKLITQDSFLKQLDPTEKPFSEKHSEKRDGPDEILNQRLEKNIKSNRNNTTIDRDGMDKYEERFKNKNGLRGMKHSDLSTEQLRSRYHDYENDHEYGERKSYRNEFDGNTLNEDEPRHRGTDNNYRNRNYERERHQRDEEVDHRNTNDLEHRGRKLERRHRNDEIDQAIKSKNYYLSNDAVNDDPLSVERRRFYQEKLENIERRLQMRNHKGRKDNPRHMRPMRPAARKSESQMNLYGRARFAHGY